MCLESHLNALMEQDRDFTNFWEFSSHIWECKKTIESCIWRYNQCLVSNRLLRNISGGTDTITSQNYSTLGINSYIRPIYASHVFGIVQDIIMKKIKLCIFIFFILALRLFPTTFVIQTLLNLLNTPKYDAFMPYFLLEN